MDRYNCKTCKYYGRFVSLFASRCSESGLPFQFYEDPAALCTCDKGKARTATALVRVSFSTTDNKIVAHHDCGSTGQSIFVGYRYRNANTFDGTQWFSVRDRYCRGCGLRIPSGDDLEKLNAGENNGPEESL